LNRDEELYAWEVSKYPQLTDLNQQLAPYVSLYQTFVDFQKSQQNWMNGAFLKLEPEIIDNEVGKMWRSINKLLITFETNQNASSLCQVTKEQIQKFKDNMPLVINLCNPGIRERHWNEISEAIGFKFIPDETTNLSQVLEKGLERYFQQ
jgi:dynein heavy chain